MDPLKSLCSSESFYLEDTTDNYCKGAVILNVIDFNLYIWKILFTFEVLHENYSNNMEI